MSLENSEKLKYETYISIYKMKQELHSPTLESVKMVGDLAEKYSGEFGKYQLWKKLPRKMMYQTFTQILTYLEQCGKLVYDKEEKIVWIWNPELIRKYLARPDLAWKS